MDSLKRALKGIFKRGKKNKQQEQDKTQQGRGEAAATTNTNALLQLPPVRDASPLQSPGEQPAKALPPTHPLATGQHTQPQEAVPQKHDAQPGPPSTSGEVESKVATSEETRIPKMETPATATNLALQSNDPLAPATATSEEAEEAEKNAASATDMNDPLAPPTKTDSGLGEEYEANEATKENLSPQINTDIDSNDEQAAATHEEPPPIKAVKAAPGMSATSGPLEDYPEGGEQALPE